VERVLREMASEGWPGRRRRKSVESPGRAAAVREARSARVEMRVEGRWCSIVVGARVDAFEVRIELFLLMAGKNKPGN
jgi:hypothetical protein